MRSLQARLKRLEDKYHLHSNGKIYIFSIGDDGDFPTQEALDQELTKPKYKDATIIIDDWAAMRKEMDK